jgi:hypothetical protein
MTAIASPSAPLGQRAETYWVESRQPLASLIFIAPLLLVYEVGVLVLGQHGVRNGADNWLRQTLDQLGFGQYFLLPVLTVCTLLAWHHLTHHPWRISRGVFYGMTGECLLLAICLRLLLQLQIIFKETLASGMKLDIASGLGATAGYLGAGIYEELLFRLLLLSLTAWLLRRLSLTTPLSMVGAVLLTSLLFAVAHHVWQFGETFNAGHFLFRFLAGIFFAVLFVYRGFGIAAGTHAGYDILVGLA